MAEALVPMVQWAQRKDQVFLTVDIQDSQQAKVSFSNNESAKSGQLSLSCLGNQQQQYKLNLDLYDMIVPDESKYSVIPRHIFIVLKKADDNKEYWPYLVKGKKKESHIKVDWNKWVDEDEEEEGADLNMDQYQNNFNFGEGEEEGYQEEEDSDDENEEKDEDDEQEEDKMAKDGPRENEKLDA